MIQAINYIKTGFSAEDAKKLDAVIKPLFDKGEKIQVDFEGITIFTTLFFNNLFAKYIMEIGPQKYNELFSLNKLSELGETTYKHSFDNAIRYYNMSETEREKIDKNMENPDD